MRKGLLVAAWCAGCAAPVDPAACGTTGALSTCLSPSRPSDHYVSESLLYFDTLDSRADPNLVPKYSPLVARWEWPPWLKLTGFEKQVMIDSDRLLTQQEPSTVPTRECRAFKTQPFGRCHVTFQFAAGPCAIYEEFTFNDAGETTFIEAWTDTPELGPATVADRWAERPGVHRLSTKVPGLGNAQGLIDLEGAAMRDAAAKDEEIADFVMRANDFWNTWTRALQESGPELYKIGCGW